MPRLTLSSALSEFKNMKKIYFLPIIALIAISFFPWRINVAQAVITCTAPQTCQSSASIPTDEMASRHCVMSDFCDSSGGQCCDPPSGGAPTGTGGSTTGGTTPGGSPPSTSTTSEGATPTIPLQNPLGSVTSVPQLIGNIIKTILTVVGALALGMFVYGGFTWLTSGGSSERIKKGKDILVWAVIGLVVIFASYTAVDFVLTAFGVS